MKQQPSTLQFTAYPSLPAAKAEQHSRKSVIFIVSPENWKTTQKTLVKKAHDLANDPKSWDTDWFNHYE